MVYGPTHANTVPEEPEEAFDAIKVGNRKYSVHGKKEHVHDQDFLIHIMHGFALAIPGEYRFQGCRVVVEEV
jgi:hypothetical protein